MNTGQIAILVDRSQPYPSSLTTDQKQYVGLADPTGATPPVREGEGDPWIPTPAVADALRRGYGRV